jgi:hypothetical protein
MLGLHLGSLIVGIILGYLFGSGFFTGLLNKGG